MASLGEQYHLKPSGTLPIQTEIPEGICGKVRQGFPGQSAELLGIAIISPSDIWAVGGGFGSSHPGPLVMHFDGKQWSQVTVPGNGSLIGVTAVSTDDVWAVGNRTPVGGGESTSSNIGTAQTGMWCQARMPGT